MSRAPRRRTAALWLLVLMVALAGIGGGASLLRSDPTATLGERPAGLAPTSRCGGGIPAGEIITTSTWLLTCPDRYDRRTVTIAGEIVGQVFGEGRRRWVQLNDDAYAFAGPLELHHQTLGANSGIAVLLPEGVQPEVLGGAGMLGDRLEVSGTFLLVSPQDQGGPAVIADEVRLVANGREVRDPLDPRHALAAMVLVVIAAGVWLDVARDHRRR